MPHGMDKKIFRKLKKKKKKRIHQSRTVCVLLVRYTRGPQLMGQLFVMFDQQGRPDSCATFPTNFHLNI